VLHITPYLEPAWAYGPVPAAVWRLATAQAVRGWDVSVLTTDAMAPHERLPVGASIIEGVQVVRVRNVVGLVTSWLQVSTPVGWQRAARVLLARDPLIVHLHELRSLEARLIAPLVPKRASLVASTHGRETRVTEPLAMRVRVQERLLRRGWSRIDQVIVESRSERDAVLNVAARNVLRWSEAHVSIATNDLTSSGSVLQVYERLLPRVGTDVRNT